MLSATQIGKKCLWRFSPQAKFSVKTVSGAVKLSGMVNTNTGT
eukprot:SAG31_NODE_38219_length_298_cov_0.683417_1_plen_42_part_01